MRRDDFKQLLQRRILVGDGATGTLLREMGALTGDGCPDLLNLTAPEAVQQVHARYFAVGADLVHTNTFGANRLKLANYDAAEHVGKINQRGAYLARQAAAANGGGLVAGNIGPCGQFLQPYGPLSFDEAASIFYEQAQALVAAAVDLLLIETMSDLHEAKAAIVGARAATSTLPVICSLTYTQEMRLLTGADPETAITVLEALGVDVVGVNCGFGPDMMPAILQRQFAISDSFLLVQPNAGLPQLQNGRTVYSLSASDFASYVPALVANGANIINGCCGTTPEYMRLVAAQAQRLSPRPRSSPRFSKLAGATETVCIGQEWPTRVIGERINPTANQRLATALRQRDFKAVADEARVQAAAGADLLDINVGLSAPGVQETELMPEAVMAAQRAVPAPLVIDTADSQVMESALRVYRGKPLLNSTSGHAEQLEQMTDLAQKYGAAIVGLTLDENGIPDKASARLAIAQRIVDRALAKGIRRQDIYIDTLTLTVGASQEQLLETLQALRWVKEQLGVRTLLGVSNVSHGMPRRAAINSVFLAMALGAGLDLPIINPDQAGVWEIIYAADVLTNRDPQAQRYLTKMQEMPAAVSTPVAASASAPGTSLSSLERLQSDILTGEKGHLPQLTQTLLDEGWTATDIINQGVIPAMEQASDKYDQHIFFLPQLLLAAEAAQETFQILRPELEQKADSSIGTVVIATVAGDIHDIGKSIVSLLLQNNNFAVIDLGKDVPCQDIIDAAQQAQADIIMLSALMTTTMPQMKVVVQAAQKEGLAIPIMVGGAVVTPAYAASIGAHYAADATEAVRVAKQLLQ